MNTKRLLIGLPLLTIAIMVQSAFWVPSQKRQAQLTPERLEQYYEGSIADAAILNPILNADGASSSICAKVFDGLLDYDENLIHRGRLATSWTISEKAYLWIDRSQRFPDGTKITAKEVLNRIREAKKESSFASITDLKILEPSLETVSVPPELVTEKDPIQEIKIQYPQRLEITLSQVEQDLFKDLARLLGPRYVPNIKTSQALKDIPFEKAQKLAPLLVSAASHHPILDFQLRKNVTFHDGEPFTAEDVKFTFESIMNGKNLSPRRSDYEPVKEVRILNPHSLRIIYKRLYSPAIGTWSMGILPKHLLDEKALKKEAKQKGADPNTFTMRSSSFNQNPIGTGAYKFENWKQDQFIRLKANEKYWEGAPHYKEFVFRVLPDSLAQEMEFYAGALDGYAPRPIQVERLKKNPDYQSFSGLSYGYVYIGYNLRRPLFKDKRVRKALGMAMDVETMIRYINYGHAQRITGPFLQQTPYYNQNLPPLPYDPKGALKLLEEAGWIKNDSGRLVHKVSGEPFRFTLLTNNGNDIRKGIMTVAQQAWAKLGIEISIQTVEWTVFLKKHVNEGNFDAIVLGWSMGIDPDLFQIWHSSQTHPQELNFVGYQNPKADDLIIRIRQEYNQEKLIKYCHDLHQIIYEDQPYTFLTVGKWTALLDKRIVRKLGANRYERIKSTKTGNYTFYFNEWTKLNKLPRKIEMTYQ